MESLSKDSYFFSRGATPLFMMKSWMKGYLPPPAMVALMRVSSSWVSGGYVVTSDGQQKVSWGDSLDAVGLGDVARQLEHFRSDVLQDRGRTDCGGSADSVV